MCIYGYQGGDEEGLRRISGTELSSIIVSFSPYSGNDCSVVISFFFFNKFPIFLPPRVEKKFVYLEFYYYLWLRSVDCDYYRRASSTTNLIFTSLLFLFDFFLRISNFLRYRKNHASSIFKSLPHSIKNNGALLSFLLLLLPEQMKFQSRSKPT